MLSAKCNQLAPNGVCSKVVLLDLLAECDVDTLRDRVVLLLLAVVDGLKRLISLKPLSGQRDWSYLKFATSFATCHRHYIIHNF